LDFLLSVIRPGQDLLARYGVTVKLVLVLLVPAGVVTAIGPDVAPAGTVAKT